MANLQFIALLIPAIGSIVLVILAWVNQNQRAGDLREDMNRRFTDLKGDMNLRFDQVSKRLDGVDRRLDGIDKRLDGVDGELKRFIKLEGRVEEISRR